MTDPIHYEVRLFWSENNEACVVLTERHDCFDILTTDARDFRNVMGSRGRHFRLIPYDL